MGSPSLSQIANIARRPVGGLGERSVSRALTIPAQPARPDPPWPSGQPQAIPAVSRNGHARVAHTTIVETCAAPVTRDCPVTSAGPTGSAVDYEAGAERRCLAISLFERRRTHTLGGILLGAHPQLGALSFA